MNRQEHRGEAERLIKLSRQVDEEFSPLLVQQAQVHATLACTTETEWTSSSSLGDITDALRAMRDGGMTRESVLYCVERVWPS